MKRFVAILIVVSTGIGLAFSRMFKKTDDLITVVNSNAERITRTEEALKHIDTRLGDLKDFLSKKKK